ncbi:hypothetical protein ACERK3_07690 [Phycisphaerales bacterium AB-hyl4]|uniref:Zinc ribbon domain-containing protein n=1 Tax=Natronomicrosphaera hydrolytica TaxID=3242702 RepID=A0ABV4U3R5_9BACT
MINPAMFGGYRESSSSAHASRSAASAQSAASSARQDVYHLEERLERLSLVCMAMWSLIQDKTNLTEEELLERVRVIDMMDGVADGKASRTIAKCPKCSRTMSPRHQHCIYCGAERLVQSAFDAV